MRRSKWHTVIVLDADWGVHTVLTPNGIHQRHIIAFFVAPHVGKCFIKRKQVLACLETIRRLDQLFFQEEYILFSVCLVAHGSILDFASMIKKVTGKNAMPEYTSYGCHCGLGGGGEPVDATDRCCQTHDCCYAKVGGKGCKAKTSSYKFNMSDGKVVCGGFPNDCGRLVCECDKAAALCFKTNIGTYNWQYRLKLDFTCKGSSPAC
ncbi:basic phospholipase A2 homolog ammodytin L-like [Lissotriton helveticus]